jgi:apolipoprotein N-acyltransferase
MKPDLPRAPVEEPEKTEGRAGPEASTSHRSASPLGHRGDLRRAFIVRLALCVLSGILLFLCFPDFNWSWLVWIACVPLILATIAEPRLFRAYLLGAVSGAVFLAGSVYWFITVMEHYGQLSPVLALGVLVLFLVVESVFWGAFGLLTAWMARRSVPLALVASPFLWAALDLGRTYYPFTGFPWNLVGYVVPGDGLRQIASVTGVYGLSFVAIASSALVAALICFWRSPERRKLAVALAAWCALLAGGNWALHPPTLARGANVAVLVQPNVPLNEAASSWEPWRNPAPLQHLIEISTEAARRAASTSTEPPLIIWSENSAPFYFNRDPIFRTAIEGLARSAASYVITGTVNFKTTDESEPLNSAVVLDPTGREIRQYDKIHLVPFGEYVPDWFSGRVGKITAGVSNFVAGSSTEPARTAEGAIGIFICYESIFPQLVRRLTPTGSGVLVTISNDAWYGHSSAAGQHLEMVRMRAIENRRYVLRSTNDGITAAVDPYGRIIDRLPRDRRGVLTTRFNFESQQTFYHAHGDVFAWLAVAASVLLLATRAVLKLS